MLFVSICMTFRRRKAAQLFRVKGKREEKVNARRVGQWHCCWQHRQVLNTRAGIQRRQRKELA